MAKVLLSESVAKEGVIGKISIDKQVDIRLSSIHSMTSHMVNSMTETKDRSSAEYAVLGIVVNGSAHGYEVYRELHDRLGTVHHLGRSQVYGLLSRLERDGLIRHEHVEQERVPDKKVFSPTAQGRSLLTQWILKPVHHVRNLRLEFLTKLYFAGLDSKMAEIGLLQAQIRECRNRAELVQLKLESSLNIIERHAFEYRLAMIQCSITWLETIKGEAEASSPQAKKRGSREIS